MLSASISSSPVGTTTPFLPGVISSFMPVSSLTITRHPAGERLGGGVAEAVLVGGVDAEARPLQGREWVPRGDR